MDANKVNILAGMLARSNMGMPRPEVWEVTQIKPLPTSRFPVDLDSAVTHFCQQYMESDEHYDIFMGEGKMWVGIIQEKGEEQAAKDWPWAFELYDQAA